MGKGDDEWGPKIGAMRLVGTSAMGVRTNVEDEGVGEPEI
jgi:hypothetical protein